MPVFEKTSELACTADALFSYHARRGALRRLTPPFVRVRNVVEATALEDGAEASFEMSVGPLWPRWIAVHHDVEPGRGFVDVMKDGPFASWRHEHRFEDAGAGRTRLVDRVTYELPGGVRASFVERRLAPIFEHRHATTALDLSLLQAFPHEPLVVGITGASGLIGRELSALLQVAGHTVVPLVRKSAASGQARWDPATGIVRWDGPPFDVVVHLAGEPISAGRLDEDHAERVRDSRVQATARLRDGLTARARPPRAFIAAAAVGYYGDRGDEELEETSASGEGVLAEICEAWERAALATQKRGIRAAVLRCGVVLSPAGGALARMLPVFRAGAGARLGDGSQWMPLLSVDEAAAVFFRAAVDDDVSGVVNAVGEQPMRNRDFTALLGRVLRRPARLVVPRVAARALFGAAADEAFLASQRVLPARLTALHHPFRHATVEAALRHVLGR